MFGIANIGCLALSGYNADIGKLLCAFPRFLISSFGYTAICFDVLFHTIVEQDGRFMHFWLLHLGNWLGRF